MKPFYVARFANYSRMMKLVRWTKKYSKYGAYAEVEEYSTDGEECWYQVELFCPKIHTKIVKSWVI